MNSPSRSQYLAIVALVVITVMWGYNWVVMKVALRYAEAWDFAAMRTFLAAVFLFILLAILRRPMRVVNFPLTLTVALFGGAGSGGLSMWALETGGAGKTAVLVYTMPIWLVVISRISLGERIRGLQWLPVVFGMGGLFFVLEPWNMQGSLLSKVLGVSCGICWAVSAVAAKILMGRYQADILSLSAWQMLLGSIPLIIVAATGERVALVWSGPFIAALLFNIVPASALGLFLWYYALRALPARTAGFATLGAPVVGVASAWIQLGERADAYELIGVVLILLGLCILMLRGTAAGHEADRAANRAAPP